MFDAQILIAPSITSGDVFSVLGPWMPKGGDNVTIALESIAESLTSLATFGVELYTKNSEDVGDGTVTGTSISWIKGTDTLGVKTATSTGEVKELVRYRFTMDDVATVKDFFMFRMNPPVWTDSVAGSVTP
jgi:hypothetical protein